MGRRKKKKKKKMEGEKHTARETFGGVRGEERGRWGRENGMGTASRQVEVVYTSK